MHLHLGIGCCNNKSKQFFHRQFLQVRSERDSGIKCLLGVLAMLHLLGKQSGSFWPYNCYCLNMYSKHSLSLCLQQHQVLLVGLYHFESSSTIGLKALEQGLSG
uniref:Uncharacterized protein n=1 Tax=uncultured marine group II/III euryarchaeote KM3_03_G06 TaxID=1457834 RepID=A0A075G344_9EURY|nr:hypothetical protein [uncultured marine group II/III euryarchaeote KM3_03_G06]